MSVIDRLRDDINTSSMTAYEKSYTNELIDELEHQYAICYELPDEVVAIFICYSMVELLEEWNDFTKHIELPEDTYFCTVYTGGIGNWSARYDFVPTQIQPTPNDVPTREDL